MLSKKILMYDAIIIILVLTILLNSSTISAHSQIVSNNNLSYNTSKIAGVKKPLQNTYSIVNNSAFVPLFPKKSLASNVRIPLSSAVSIAERYTGKNISATLGMLYAEKGFMSYVVLIADSNNTMYKILVNPLNGKVLSYQHFPILYGALPLSISRSSNISLHSLNNKESNKTDFTHDTG